MKLKMPDKLAEQNLARAMVGETTLNDYIENRGEGCADRDAIVDLITDLCHLLHLDEKTAGCMTHADIEATLAAAYNHFYCEAIEPDDITLASLEA